MSNTKAQILDAAERAFAEKGIDGASLRFITGEAGANLGSIHYYFGSKEILVLDVFHRRINEFNRTREDQLRQMGQGQQPPSLKEIWSSLTRAITEFQRKYPDFVRFIERLLWSEDTRFLQLVQDREFEFDRAFLALVQAHFPPELAEPVKERSVLLIHMINHAILNRFLLEKTLKEKQLSLDDEQIAENLADIAVGALGEFQANA